MITAEQLKDVKERTEALRRYLDIDAKLIQVEEEQLRTQAPGFWDDAKKAEAQMKKVKSLQAWLDGYKEVKNLADEAELAFDFCKDGLVSETELDEAYAKAIEAIEALELKNMLRQEADQMDCVLKINSGAGGTESQDWASMLMRMYMRWAEANKYKVAIANLQEGHEATSSPPASRGIPSEAAAPAVRTSTRWNPACGCAISTKTPTRARRRKSSLKTPRRATSRRTRKTPCASCAPSSTKRR